MIRRKNIPTQENSVLSDLGKIDWPLRVFGPITICVACDVWMEGGHQQPWFLVRHACLKLRRLMPAGRPCQVGAGLLGLFNLRVFIKE